MPKYVFECALPRYREENFLSVWRHLLSLSSSPEKIYQTPEFFEFVQKTKAASDRNELLSITRRQTNGNIGIVPLRFREQAFEFRFGSRMLLAPTVQVAMLLGSTPLFPMESGLFDEVVHEIFSRFPSVDAISMAALPLTSELQEYIKDSTSIRALYNVYVMHDWRETHAIPLPEHFDQYLQQFSAKKRFNLNRQIRQLREHGNGQLQLDRIERPEQVANFIIARNSLIEPKMHSAFLSEDKFTVLAEQGLLLSYVMSSGGQPCAVILATRSEYVLHIHNILYLSTLARLSVGTSILHLAIEDLITNFKINSIDLGYSNPSYSHQSSNAIELRGHVLLLRKTWRNKILRFSHRLYVKQIEIFKSFLENYRRRLKSKKKAPTSSKLDSPPTVYLDRDKANPKPEQVKK